MPLIKVLLSWLFVAFVSALEIVYVLPYMESNSFLHVFLGLSSFVLWAAVCIGAFALTIDEIGPNVG